MCSGNHFHADRRAIFPFSVSAKVAAIPSIHLHSAASLAMYPSTMFIIKFVEVYGVDYCVNNCADPFQLLNCGNNGSRVSAKRSKRSMSCSY